MDCLQKVSTNVERSHRPPWPQPAAHAHASSADSMAGPPTAVGTATEAVGGNWDVCSGPDRSSVWKRPWAPKAACAQSCRVRLPGRIETRPGSTHIRITQISISRRDSVEIRSPGISIYIYYVTTFTSTYEFTGNFIDTWRYREIESGQNIAGRLKV